MGNACGSTPSSNNQVSCRKLSKDQTARKAQSRTGKNVNTGKAEITSRRNTLGEKTKLRSRRNTVASKIRPIQVKKEENQEQKGQIADCKVLSNAIPKIPIRNDEIVYSESRKLPKQPPKVQKKLQNRRKNNKQQALKAPLQASSSSQSEGCFTGKVAVKLRKKVEDDSHVSRHGWFAHWQSEEKRLQLEYKKTEDKIRSSLREEQRAKAETETWRARLERLSKEHRNGLFHQSYAMRRKLRRAENLLSFYEGRARKIHTTNSKLRGLIDTMQRDANKLKDEGEKRRISSQKKLDQKVGHLVTELNKLKCKIGVTSNIVLPNSRLAYCPLHKQQHTQGNGTSRAIVATTYSRHCNNAQLYHTAHARPALKLPSPAFSPHQVLAISPPSYSNEPITAGDCSPPPTSAWQQLAVHISTEQPTFPSPSVASSAKSDVELLRCLVTSSPESSAPSKLINISSSDDTSCHGRIANLSDRVDAKSSAATNISGTPPNSRNSFQQGTQSTGCYRNKRYNGETWRRSMHTT